MNFDDDYGGSIMTGGGLKDQLAASGETELVLTITSVSRRPFKDAKDPEWVLSFRRNARRITGEKTARKGHSRRPGQRKR